ncbi:DUF362 domain-containing protein [Solidesulfovibrio carbinolicus]|uniref:4Fe-4S ferredoxin n=1 Tax=Solidesulfovibrio carbinolicus TaxID=296842 RepID=A0A4P6HKP9_9BACT|nr:DUF362 domain-containing protein [Solidesulfovibrio carbinolicus]QAZ66470.1 4Fe-4S ferredoxin [Solidesulfovibrio carbinolicus]
MTQDEAPQPAKVYFADLRARAAGRNRTAKIQKLFEAAGFGDVVQKGDLTAIKLHFGERGCDTHISPTYARAVVELVKAQGGRPFVTDTNTLYSGSRHNAVDHLLTAVEHGFDYAVLGAPVIIADGLDSTNVLEVPISGKHFQKVKIAGDIVRADSLLVLSHFKGHELAGFGGAVKNLAMGCAPRAGKQDQHCVRFVVEPKKCIGCAECVAVCPVGAAAMKGKKAVIDKAACIGCGECLTVCPKKAMSIDWGTEIVPFMERMVEYALGAVTGKTGRVGYVNFLVNVTPDCDCVPWSDAPIVPDIGFLASSDPVALDKACLDLVNEQAACPECKLEHGIHSGEDKFTALWQWTRGDMTFVHGAAVGLGRPEYELVRV